MHNEQGEEGQGAAGDGVERRPSSTTVRTRPGRRTRFGIIRCSTSTAATVTRTAKNRQ
jgi:hypothetical protein